MSGVRDLFVLFFFLPFDSCLDDVFLFYSIVVGLAFSSAVRASEYMSVRVGVSISWSNIIVSVVLFFLVYYLLNAFFMYSHATRVTF